MPKQLIPAVGNWVDGDRFWDRKTEVQLFIDHLDGGDSILLVAQRRIGKTSLMHEVSRQLGDRYVCLHVDLENSHSPADAVAELSAATRNVQGLWTKTKSLFSNILTKIAGQIDFLQYEELKLQLRAGMDAANWNAKGCALFELMADHEKNIVLFFDEVPILVNRILKGNDYTITPERTKLADEFMSWLRYCMQNKKGNVRVVLTGSVGLGPILKQAGLSATINSFTPFELRPWDEETAIGCLEALGLAKNLKFENGVCQKMVSRLGSCIPHHVQLYFQLVHTHCAHKQCNVVSSSDAEEVYEKSMLSSRGHAELSHYEERLRMVLGIELLPLALDLLSEAAVVGKLTQDAAFAICDQYEIVNARSALTDILHVLDHDGYVERVRGGNNVFVSKLLRDWWKAHFAYGYVPVSVKGAPNA